jgi:hypothetical protein
MGLWVCVTIPSVYRGCFVLCTKPKDVIKIKGKKFKHIATENDVVTKEYKKKRTKNKGSTKEPENRKKNVLVSLYLLTIIFNVNGLNLSIKRLRMTFFIWMSISKAPYVKGLFARMAVLEGVGNLERPSKAIVVLQWFSLSFSLPLSLSAPLALTCTVIII